MLCNLLAASVLAISCPTVSAEEQIQNPTKTTESVQGSKFSLYTYTGPFRLSTAREVTGLSSPAIFRPTEDWRLDTFLRSYREHADLDNESTVMLFRKQLPSRFSYHSWAGLGTGYGQFLSTNALGRSRTNGAGIQEPDWFYLKMSVMF